MSAASKMPDDPKSWLARAHSNLLLAETGEQRGVFLEDLCFEAQQAVEKALKAICVSRKIEFPKTHSIVTLTALLEQSGIVLPPEVMDAEALTSYAVQARYPDWEEGVTESEYQRTLATAKQVITWAEKIILKDQEA